MNKGKLGTNKSTIGSLGVNSIELDTMENKARSQIDIKNLQNFEFKVILIGESGVGKSSIMTKFITNEFKSAYQSTLGIEFKVKEMLIDNEIYARLRIWDTCGQERFRAITRQYFQNAQGVLLVFDLTSKDTVKKLNDWLNDLNQHVTDDCVIFVIGNKLDIKTRDLSISEEAKQFANDKKLNYFEVSAKTGSGIANIFEKMTRKIVNNVKNKANDNADYTKNLNRNLNIDTFSNQERGKIEGNIKSKFHCC